MSKNNQSIFEFKYEGENFIDLNTLLTSQFHFLATFNEIQKELHPDASVKIKVGAFKEGSFILELISETTWIDTLFNSDNINIAGQVLSGFASIIGIKEYLKGKKADKIEEKNGNIEISVGDKSPIIINKAVFNIYQNSQIVNKSIEKNFEILEKDVDIEGIKITEVKDSLKQDVLTVDREQFKELSCVNEYLERSQSENILFNERLFIKKPNLFPEKDKIWKWGFLHRGRDITAIISDKSFLNKINDGLRVGQGDRLTVDLKVYYKWDERFMTFIESNRFEVTKVEKIDERNEQTKFDFNNFN